jgi:hypothetical protein
LLRHDEFTAPCVVDGPIDGKRQAIKAAGAELYRTIRLAHVEDMALSIGLRSRE